MRAAEKAGVKVGDVVTAVDGKDIRSMDDLIVPVRRHAIGDTVKLTVRRGDQTLTLNVAVGDKPVRLQDAVHGHHGHHGYPGRVAGSSEATDTEKAPASRRGLRHLICRRANA